MNGHRVRTLLVVAACLAGASCEQAETSAEGDVPSRRDSSAVYGLASVAGTPPRDHDAARACEIPFYSEYRFARGRWELTDSIRFDCEGIADARPVFVAVDSGFFYRVDSIVEFFDDDRRIGVGGWINRARLRGDSLVFEAGEYDPGDFVYLRTSSDALAVSAHFTVDSSAYTLRRDGEGWTTSIGYLFRNPLPDTVSVVNCNGAIVMDLQKHVGTEWQSVWYGMSNGCLSPPIVVLPGDSIEGRIEVWAADPGHPNFPTFETADMDGEFRLIWHHLRTNYSGDVQSFGDTLSIAQKTSTTFRIERT